MLTKQDHDKVVSILISELSQTDLTQKQLSDQIGMHSANLGRWLRKESCMSYKAANKVALYFGYADWQNLLINYDRNEQVNARKLVASMSQRLQREVFLLLAQRLVAHA